MAPATGILSESDPLSFSRASAFLRTLKLRLRKWRTLWHPQIGMQSVHMRRLYVDAAASGPRPLIRAALRFGPADFGAPTLPGILPQLDHCRVGFLSPRLFVASREPFTPL